MSQHLVTLVLWALVAIIASVAGSSSSMYPLPFIPVDTAANSHVATDSMVYRIGNINDMVITTDSYSSDTNNMNATIRALNVSNDGTKIWEYTIDGCPDISERFDTLTDTHGRWLAVAVCTHDESDSKATVVALDAITGVQVWRRDGISFLQQQNAIIAGEGMLGLIEESRRHLIRLQLHDGQNISSLPLVASTKPNPSDVGFKYMRFPDWSDHIASSYFTQQSFKAAAKGWFVMHIDGLDYLLNLVKFPTVYHQLVQPNDHGIPFAPVPTEGSSLVGYASSVTETDYNLPNNPSTTTFHVSIIDASTYETVWSRRFTEPSHSYVREVGLHLMAGSDKSTVVLTTTRDLYTITSTVISKKERLASGSSSSSASSYNVRGGIHFINYGTSDAAVLHQDMIGNTQLLRLNTGVILWQSTNNEFSSCYNRNILFRIADTPADNKLNADYILGCTASSSSSAVFTAFSMSTGKASYTFEMIAAYGPAVFPNGIVVARGDTDTNMYGLNAVWYQTTETELGRWDNLHALVIDGITYTIYTGKLLRNYITAVSPDGRRLWTMQLPPGTISTAVEPFAFRHYIVVIINDVDLVFVSQLTGKTAYNLAARAKCLYSDPSHSVDGIGAVAVMDTPGQPRELFFVGSGNKGVGCLLKIDSDLHVKSTNLAQGTFITYYSETVSLEVLKNELLIRGNSKLHIYDRSTLKLRWNVMVNQYTTSYVTLPNAIFVVNAPTVRAFRLQDGLQLWTHTVDTSTVGSPFLRANILYIGGSQSVVALRTEVQLPADTPRVKWEFSPPSTATSTYTTDVSSIGNLILFVTGSDVYGLHYNTGVLQYTTASPSTQCAMMSGTSPTLQPIDNFGGYMFLNCGSYSSGTTTLMNPISGKMLATVPADPRQATKYNNDILLVIDDPHATMGVNLSALVNPMDIAPITIPTIPRSTPLSIPTKFTPPTAPPTPAPHDKEIGTVPAQALTSWTEPRTVGTTLNVLVGNVSVEFNYYDDLTASAYDTTKHGNALWETVIVDAASASWRTSIPKWVAAVGTHHVAVVTSSFINVLDVRDGSIVWNTTNNNFMLSPSPLYLPSKNLLVIAGVGDFKLFGYNVNDGTPSTFHIAVPGTSYSSDSVNEMLFDPTTGFLVLSAMFVRDGSSYSWQTYVAAYNIETKAKVWNITDDYKQNTLCSLVPGTSKMLWVMNNNSKTIKMMTIDTKTGNPIGTVFQTKEADRIVPSQILSGIQPNTNDLVVVLFTEHEVYTFKNHEPLWGYQDSSSYWMLHTGEGRIMFEQNLVLVQSMNKVFGLSLDSGKNLWNISKSNGGQGRGQPLSIVPATSAGPDMYVIGTRDVLLANIKSGKVAWMHSGSHDVQEMNIVSMTPPASSARNVVVFTKHCRSTCAPTELVELNQNAFGVPGNTYVADGHNGIITVNSAWSSAAQSYTEFLHRFSSTGALIWQRVLEQNPYTLTTFGGGKYVLQRSSGGFSVMDILNSGVDVLPFTEFTAHCTGLQAGTGGLTVIFPKTPQDDIHVVDDILMLVGNRCFLKIDGSKSTPSVSSISVDGLSTNGNTMVFAPFSGIVVFLNIDDSSIVVYNSNTMKKMWSYELRFTILVPTRAGGVTQASVVADPTNTTLFLAASDVVMAMEATTGVVVWRNILSKALDAPVVSDVALQGPVYFDNSLFVADNYRGVSRLDIALHDGDVNAKREKWTTKLPEEKPELSIGPIVSPEYGVVVVSTINNLYAIDYATGTIKWSKTINGCQQLDTVSTVLVAQCHGLYVLDLFSGDNALVVGVDTQYTFMISARVTHKAPFQIVWSVMSNSYVNDLPDYLFASPPPVVQQTPFVPYQLPAGYHAPTLPPRPLPTVDQLLRATTAPVENHLVTPILNMTRGSNAVGAAVNANGYSLLVGSSSSTISSSDVFGVQMSTKKIVWRVQNVCNGHNAGGVVPWSSSRAGVYCSSGTSNILRLFDTRTGANTKNITFSAGSKITSTSMTPNTFLRFGSTLCLSMCDTSGDTGYYSTCTPTVACYNVASANQVWNVSCPTQIRSASPATLHPNGDKITILWPTNSDMKATNVKSSSGAVVWQLDVEDVSWRVSTVVDSTGKYIVQGPATINNTKYIFTVYNAVTGAVMARHSNASVSSVARVQVAEYDATTYVVVTTNYGVHCFVLAGASATHHWSVLNTPYIPSVAISGDDVIYSSGDHSVSVINLRTGTHSSTMTSTNAMSGFDSAVVLSTTRTLLVGSSLTLLDTSANSVYWQSSVNIIGEPMLLKNSFGAVDQLLVSGSTTSLRWIDVRHSGWAYTSASPHDSRALVLSNSVLVSHASTLYSFDPASGAPQWNSTVSTTVRDTTFPPTLIGSDFVAVSGDHNEVGIFFKGNGTLLAKYSLPACGLVFATSTNWSPVTYVSTMGNTLYMTGGTHGTPCLYAIDITSATISNPPKVQTLAFNFPITRAPATGPSDTALIFDDFDMLHAVRGGKVIWNLTLTYTATTLQLASYGNFIYAADLNMLYCIDAATGQILWMETQFGSQIVTPPVGYNGHVYVGTTTGLVKLDISLDTHPTTRILWESSVLGMASQISAPTTTMSAQPLVTKYGLIIAVSDSIIYATDATTGKIVWARAGCYSPEFQADRLFAMCLSATQLDIATGNELADVGVQRTMDLSATSDTLAVTNFQKVMVVPIATFSSTTNLPAVAIQPEPTNTVPADYTPPPVQTLPTSIPDGQFMPDLECVSRVQYQQKQFQTCVNEMIINLYGPTTSDRSTPVNCYDAARQLEDCRNMYLIAVTRNCPAGIALYREFASSLRQSDSFQLCDHSHKCTKSSDASLVCSALELPAAWTPAPGSPILVPDFSFSVAPVQATYPPAAAPSHTPTPKHKSSDSGDSDKKKRIVIGVSVVGVAIAAALLVAVVKITQSKKTALQDGEEWREEALVSNQHLSETV